MPLNKDSSQYSTSSIQTHQNQLSSQYSPHQHSHQPHHKILMIVYYTSILRDPNEMNQEWDIIKKQYQIQENTFVFWNKQSKLFVIINVIDLDWKIFVVKDKKEALKMIRNGMYKLVAEVKFQGNNRNNGNKKDNHLVKQNNIIKEINHHINTSNPINKSNLFTLSRRIQKQLHSPSGSPVLITNTIEDIINSSVFFTVKSHPLNLFLHPIHHNSLLKFGKQIYRVKINQSNSLKDNKIKILEYNYLYDDVHYEGKIGKPLKKEENIQKQGILQQQHQKYQKQCKICLQVSGLHSKDYMISPCKCSGSCSVVHLQCLKYWIGQKIQISSKKSHKLRSFDLSKFQCEICKMSYPKLINVNNQFIDIIPEIEINNNNNYNNNNNNHTNNNNLLNNTNDSHNPNNNTQSIMILQKLFPIQSSNNNKKITHLINLSQDQKLSLGRNIQNQLILQDMSVSRYHAQIHYKNNTFYLVDRDSRFGTFVGLNQQHQIQNLREGVLLTAKQNFVFRVVQQQEKQEGKGQVIELEESVEDAEIQQQDILQQYENEDQDVDSNSNSNNNSNGNGNEQCQNDIINDNDDDQIINEIQDQMENNNEAIYIINQSYQHQQQHQQL